MRWHGHLDRARASARRNALRTGRAQAHRGNDRRHVVRAGSSNETEVTVTYDVTSLSPDGTVFVKELEATFDAFLDEWRDDIIALASVREAREAGINATRRPRVQRSPLRSGSTPWPEAPRDRPEQRGYGDSWNPRSSKAAGRCSECVRGRLPLLEALRDEPGPLLLAPAVQHLEV
jgi:hypothetical protein